MNSLPFGKNSYSRTRNAYADLDTHIRNSKVGRFCPARLSFGAMFTRGRNGLGVFLRAFLSTVDFGWAARAVDACAYIEIARRTVSRLVWLASCSDTVENGGTALK